MQISEITTLFNTIDTNDDGQITQKEMKKSLNSLSDEQKSNISFLINDKGKLNKSTFNIIANGDKKISQNDLLSYLTTTDEDDNVVELTEEQETSRNSILNILSNIDKKKDGKITKKEIQKAYNKAVKNNDTETIEYLEKFMTTNSKGKKVVDTSTFNYLSTALVVKRKHSTGLSILKRSLGVYGQSISTSTKHCVRASSLYDLTKFDSDGDYDLSEEEMNLINEYKDFFYTIDTKQDGRISAKDIIKAYKNAEDGSETKELLSSLVTVTEKGKVKINKENFRTLAQGKKYLNSTDMLNLKTDDTTAALTNSEVTNYLEESKEFMSLDTNDNGQLTLKEIKKYAKNNSDSNLANYLTSLGNSKEMKRIFKLISNGKKFISASDIKTYDTDNDGSLSSDEITSMINKLNGN